MFPVVQQPGHEDDHSSVASAEGFVWSYTSNLPNAFVVCTVTSLPVAFTEIRDSVNLLQHGRA